MKTIVVKIPDQQNYHIDNALELEIVIEKLQEILKKERKNV